MKTAAQHAHAAARDSAGRVLDALEIRPLCVASSAIDPLIATWDGKPYGYCAGALPGGSATYVRRAIHRAAERGCQTFVASQEGAAAALLQLEELGWDSEMLGLPAARLSWWLGAASPAGLAARAQLLQHALDTCRDRRIGYLLARIPAGDIAGAMLLDEQGFSLVDGLLTFGTAPEAAVSTRGGQGAEIRCSPFESADLPFLTQIAESAFTIDRFHSDPAISRKTADHIHREWVANSCKGYADCVLVARAPEPAGFTTLKIDPAARESLGVAVGTIVLVATSSEFRGRGVARRLTQASLAWFREQGCGWVEVGTQIANIRASRVYQDAGFKLLSSSFTFRKLLPSGGTHR